MLTTNIYLTFKDNCEAAFSFYKTVFGGEFISFSKFGEMPPTEGYTVPEADKNKVMHVSLAVGESVLMGSDCGAEWEAQFVHGNNFSISLSVGSKEEADKLFAALSPEGKITMPLNTTFWGSYFGMLTDQFGINWMLNFDETGH